MYSQILHSRSHSSALDLARIQQASALFGHPERQFRSIHVGGTNGKGSVCYKIAKNLQMMGAKVGLYTSPHISSIRERIRINDELVKEEFLERHVPLMPSDLSFFEMMTLLAFIYFAKQKIDIAVIEVGLGGRLDATNIIRPDLTVITSIDYDHQVLLGATLPEIAYEKAGIIKKGVPVVLGPSAAKFIESAHVATAGGSYDEENTAIARKALELLKVQIFDEALHVRPPCRLETIKGVILDVAHNPAGLIKLFEVLPVKPYVAVVGMSADKDIAAALHIIEKNVAEVHFVKAATERAAEPSLLQALWPAGKPAFVHSSIEGGLNAALQRGPVLVTGSFYIMAPVRRLLGIDEPTDEQIIQESFLQT